MDIIINLFIQTTGAIIGIFIGTLAALALERRSAERKRRQRAQIILRSLANELKENYTILQEVRPAFRKTPWGKSFYISTSAWDTALASGDLPDIIGFTLTDDISEQYADLVQVRYYLDLLTRLWFVPTTIPGYEDKREGFRQAILQTMDATISRHNRLNSKISKALKLAKDNQ
ncbi:MAG TPA: hypothetical protein VLL52_04155 [Anaerolineae bacterium]|nr:hypothetical protein [Anaerolineae bacterium]